MTRLFTTNPFEERENVPSGGYLQQAIEAIAEREWAKKRGRPPTDHELHKAMLLVAADATLLEEARTAAAERAKR